MSAQAITCPECGATMNHHADKLIYSTDADSAAADPRLGGVIEETHTCSGCGAIETRRAE